MVSHMKLLELYRKGLVMTNKIFEREREREYLINKKGGYGNRITSKPQQRGLVG